MIFQKYFNDVPFCKQAPKSVGQILSRQYRTLSFKGLVMRLREHKCASRELLQFFYATKQEKYGLSAAYVFSRIFNEGIWQSKRGRRQGPELFFFGLKFHCKAAYSWDLLFKLLEGISICHKNFNKAEKNRYPRNLD